tara:strand:- start:1043 stop:2308 length:1266 start_codon:yes stop_codon:yes gene_type:complete
MNIVILGSGGREHALCQKISLSKKVKKIYSIPGNAGTSDISENINLPLNDVNKIDEFIKDKNIDLIVVGPEQPLVDGVVDFFEKKNINIFGPNKIASQLEGSKIFTKKLCEKYKIPSAKFGIFESAENAQNFVSESNFPLVVKADGLAAGKGVYICKDLESAKFAISEIFNGKFGKANNVLIEEFLEGEEMSYFVISDGKTYKKFETAQDHKRVGEGDQGKNTGGMGAYSPSALINDELDKKIINKIIEPTLKGLKDLGTDFKGFLYAGLMIVKNEPYLIEYNVRMGDPECQTILPRLKTDLLDLLLYCCKKNLSKIKLDWQDDKSLCVVLCSKGYPENYNNNIEIAGLNKIKVSNKEYIYHAGTEKKKNIIYSNGGRVLNFSVLSKDLKDARTKAIKMIQQLNWNNGFYRRDIGFKAIKD